jgi:hypothetical protein
MLVTVRERFDRWLLDPQLRRGVIINVRIYIKDQKNIQLRESRETQNKIQL